MAADVSEGARAKVRAKIWGNNMACNDCEWWETKEVAKVFMLDEGSKSKYMTWRQRLEFSADTATTLKP
jgi:hypothetical protein